ncbi:hypothetical protein CAI21_13795 [Alkalilimnicola ehrlichii]|uniref:MotA/TolQ/ExbB proton channel domain-containing protein n=1 Tax=Alkalilimnicola ehrlichii TaxID=351052 RepID=A0A3E0WRN0_9GAMM|nr:MotA/TolQ/ExbB proton channel family protein [Alkalilimnicola ehrlichii]RFA27986.1 hypothetical protein CAI21_13795 [Alkalilimnicola ehrlichii]RFA34635.1 hypothetical protein CAL65_14830 [Alkalilimnicola ehrlichii]
MVLLPEQWDAISRFLETGGSILWLILATAVVLWMLILERYWFHYRVYPRLLAGLSDSWQGRSCSGRWSERHILARQIADLSDQLHRSISLIRTLIALCPLLGLLGTVTGMIQVFDVIAVTGTGNPRAMASGVSMATIPTMAGMVVALSGLYFSTHLQRSARTKARLAADRLARQARSGVLS